MRPVTFGLVLPAGSPTRDGRATFVADLNRALRLITGHFDSAWMIDHLQDGTSDMLESLTTISYLAALHPQLRFGQTVICQSFRNPALLAKMGATLQFLSGGRFMLGLGAGWNEEEYRAYGYDFPPASVRVAQLEETIQIVKAMWTQEQATFQGTHHHVIDAACEPRPDPLPPILIGAFKPKMLRLTAKYADEWNVSSTKLRAYRITPSAFDIVSCIGATWIGNGLVGTLNLMRPGLRDRESLLLVGEPYWIDTPPDEAYAAMTNGDRDLFTTLAGTEERIAAAGFELVEMVLADHHGWDRYVAAQWMTVSDWLRAHPDSAEADEIRQMHARSRQEYLTSTRRFLGWGVFVLRLP